MSDCSSDAIFNLYIIYHQYIVPEFYKKEDVFGTNEVKLFKVEGYCGTPMTYDNYPTVSKNIFKTFYDSTLQKKKYMAPEIIYHFYKNNCYESEFIGFLEYDFDFKLSQHDILAGKVKIPQIPGPPSILALIRTSLLKGNTIVALSYRQRLKILYEQKRQSMHNANWLDYFIQEYSKFYGKKIDKAILLKENPIIITQQSFITNVDTFKHVMKFIAHLIDAKKFNAAKPRPSYIIDRFIGLACHLSGAEIIPIPLQHTNHHNWN